MDTSSLQTRTLLTDDMKDKLPSQNDTQEQQNMLKGSLREMLRQKITPKAKAVLHMSLCMGVHFSGHELARGPTSSMFTSKDIGFQNAAALPLCLGLVSPFTIIVLWFFSKMLHKFGPRYALVNSTLFGGSLLLFIGACLKYLTALPSTQYVGAMHSRTITRGLLFLLFMFQSSNVQFLYTQHWSFLGSILTPEEGKTWFAPIAGLGSVTSTLAASNVSTMVEKLGLIGLLCTGGLMICSSAIFANEAYKVAKENGFEPRNDGNKKNDKEHSKGIQSENIIKSTQLLFRRVPILRAMFFEVILSQFLSSLLNFHFMIKVKDTITNDEERAGWTGNCYAWINGISGVMQFFILPIATKKINLTWLWILMPSIMLFFTTMQFLSRTDPSLSLVASSFLSMKIIEYSLRGQVTEMVFASLDYESRFVGKQKIGLIANRFGKSITAVSLFLVATYYNDDESEQYHILVIGSNIAACLWLLTTINLTCYMEVSSKAS